VTNDELSAKAAGLRGDDNASWYDAYTVPDGLGTLCRCKVCGVVQGYKEDVDKRGECKKCGARSAPAKNYAEDMNAAFELIREIQAAGLIVNVEFQAESQEPYDDRWTMVQVWTVERVKVDGIMQPQQNELLVECWECSWFSPAVAICKAYIELREQQCQQ
jgi:uncharacterized protein (DUF983 family)